MIILALDLATETGCCDGAVGAASPRLWSWYLRDEGDTRPARLLGLRRFLVRYFAQEKCDAVIYEAPMPMGRFAQAPGKKGFIMSEANVAFARGMIGVCEMTCAEHSKPVEAVSVMDARASVLGWRTNRDKSIGTKSRVMADVALLAPGAENNHEADAYVLWQYACNRQNPRLAVAQTPLFRIAAGGKQT